MINQSINNVIPDDFSSHDLGLIACLLCLDFELVKIDKTNSQKVEFIIKRKKGLEDEIKNYWAYKCPVDGQTYFNNLKRLKNQIFSSNY